MRAAGVAPYEQLIARASRFLLLRGLKDVADFLTGSALAAGVGLPIILMHTDVVCAPALPLSVAQS